MAHRWLRRGRAFPRDAKGVTTLEFALIAPVVILLALAGVDTGRYIEATEAISKVANTIGQMITENSSGTVNYIDLQFYHDSAMVIFPDVLADSARQGVPWSSDIGVTMSSVKFTTSGTNCGTTCVYTPKVLWSGGTNRRSCSVTMTSTTDQSVPSPTLLPSDVYGPGSIIVVDIAYGFHPWFASWMIPTINIARSIYIAPRYVSQIAYSTIAGDNGIAAACP